MICDYLSVNKIKIFECPFRYYLQYYWQISKERGRALNVGTLAHQVFETIIRKSAEYVDKEKRVINNLDQLLIDVFKRSDYYKDAKLTEAMIKDDPIYQECKTIVTKYIASPGCTLFYDVLIENGKPCIEKRFDVIAGARCEVHGAIDIIFKLDNETLLVNDYKTSKTIQKFDEIMEDIQLKTYYWAAHKMFPQYPNVFVQIDFVRLLKPRIVTFGDINMIEKELVVYYNKIKNCTLRNAHRKPGWYCNAFCIGGENCYRLYDSVRRAGFLKQSMDLDF